MFDTFYPCNIIFYSTTTPSFVPISPPPPLPHPPYHSPPPYIFPYNSFPSNPIYKPSISTSSPPPTPSISMEITDNQPEPSSRPSTKLRWKQICISSLYTFHIIFSDTPKDEFQDQWTLIQSMSMYRPFTQLLIINDQLMMDSMQSQPSP